MPRVGDVVKGLDSTGPTLRQKITMPPLRLGAQPLLPRVDQSDDRSVLAARHFLHANDPKLWRSFLRALEAAPTDIDARAMLDAARSTFALFRNGFSAYAERAESSESVQRAAVR